MDREVDISVNTGCCSVNNIAKFDHKVDAQVVHTLRQLITNVWYL